MTDDPTYFEVLVAHHRELWNAGRDERANLEPDRPDEPPIGQLSRAQQASYWAGFSERDRLAPRRQRP